MKFFPIMLSIKMTSCSSYSEMGLNAKVDANVDVQTNG